MRSAWREYLEALLVAVIFATFARSFVVQAFKIPTGSMEANLLVGDHILVNKFVYGPTASTLERLIFPSRAVRRGDVVVFKYPLDPRRDFIKRCVALPGDRIEIRDKVLYLNGEPVDESAYVFHTDSRTYPSSVFLSDDYRYRDNFGPLEVPEDELFFMGDNRDDSHDSRFWGAVPLEFVKGRAFAIYWSFEAEESSVGWPGYLGRLRQLARVLLQFPSRTRWNRSLRLVR
jgi:signal peptidase I